MLHILSKVRFCEEAVHEGHSTLDFVVSSRYDDYELKVRILHCQGWPHSPGSFSKVRTLAFASIIPYHQVLTAVTLVQDWHLEYQNGPLVLVDR